MKKTRYLKTRVRLILWRVILLFPIYMDTTSPWLIDLFRENEQVNKSYEFTGGKTHWQLGVSRGW